MLNIVSKSVEETINIAKSIASIFNPGDLIILDGNMGAGKTHFVKGIAQYYNDSVKVISPTFNIANFYNEDDITILHIDLYRIESIEEFDNLGITEYFETSIVFMEWGNLIADNFDDYMRVSIEIDSEHDNQRKINFSTTSDVYKQKIEQIKKIISCF